MQAQMQRAAAEMDWVLPSEHSVRAAVLERVRDRRRHIYLGMRRHLARMARAAATRADGLRI